MTAEPKGVVSSDYGQQATQWFIVSDLGLAAYTTHDGIDVFIHSLASAEPRGSIEVRLIARNNVVLAVRQTDRNGFIHFEAGLARGEGGAAPAAIVASERADYAFLSLKSPAFDLSDRVVAGRPVPAGLDRGSAAPNVPLTLVIARPDGVEYRRALVPDQGLGGRSLSVPIIGSASTDEPPSLLRRTIRKSNRGKLEVSWQQWARRRFLSSSMRRRRALARWKRRSQ